MLKGLSALVGRWKDNKLAPAPQGDHQDSDTPVVAVHHAARTAPATEGDKDLEAQQASRQQQQQQDKPNTAAEDESWKKHRRDILWMKLPVISFFVQFFACVPTYANIEKLLNVLALVGALILALTVQLMSSVSADDLEAADKKFLTPGTGYYEFWQTAGAKNVVGDTNSAPSKTFAFYSSLSCVLITVEVIMVVILYTFLSMAHIVKNGPHEEEQLRQWLKYNSYLLLAALWLLIVGTCLFFLTLWYHLQIKYPDYYVEVHGRIKSIAGFTGHAKERAHTYSVVEVMQWGVFAFTVLTLAISGLGNSAVQAYNLDHNLVMHASQVGGTHR